GITYWACSRCAMSNNNEPKDKIHNFEPGAAFDASVPEESCDNIAVEDSFWNATIVVKFTDTMYLPNEYTIDSVLHDLEVLAYAYENNDPYARKSLSHEDALRVWGWIIKKRTGRFPSSLEFIDRKAKRLRRWEMGPIADPIIDCRVTPL